MTAVADGFDEGRWVTRRDERPVPHRWRGIFRDGLVAMRAQGELRDDADPDRLANVLLAAFQGGMLLAQAEHSVTPLSAALDGAIGYVSSFAVDPR
jgi:TetR/AcrR family transcriptional repressor of nem operon